MQEHLPQSMLFDSVHEKNVEGSDPCQEIEGLDHLHPNLRESFVPLPKTGVALTSEQLHAIFGGDLRAFRDMAQLVYESKHPVSNL